MEEKKNIRELAVQYFEGRIRRKDEKLLFEYVGQSEAIARHSDSGKRSGLPRALPIPIPRGVGDITTQNPHAGSHYPDAGYFENEIFRLAESGCCRSHRTSDYRRNPRVRQLSSSLQPETYFVCETPYGEKSKVVLSDGTVVWLNAGSTLKYSNKFNTANRRVELNGEGYLKSPRKRELLSSCRHMDMTSL